MTRVRRSLAVVVVGLVLAAAVAVLSGSVGIVSTNGVSMNPTYYQGDLVIVTAEDHYSVGQIVAYRDHVHHLTVLHRIVGREPAGYEFKGDNNESIDAVHPTQADLIGRAVLHIPHAGNWLHILTGPVPLALTAVALLAAAGTARTRRRRRRRTMSRHSNRRGPSPVSFGAVSPRLRTAAGGTAAVVAVGLALAAVSWRHPVHTMALSKHQQTQSMAFSYAATVPHSPAYDSTTASSPGPVFRRLTDTVNVHFAYHGGPGILTVDADLSAASGWHSTIPLQAPTTLDANNHDGMVRLDLSALERRAHAAAAVTGLPTDPLTVTVVPHVTAADGTNFAPPLRLTLTPLALTLADDPKNLNVTKVTTVRRNELVSATLSLHGRHITVATGRVIASALLLFAALAALILAWLKRRTAPANESAAIRMRYAALLLPVHPISTPSGHTVIDVTNFATLAKLAECQGLHILHWSRSHVETFIMQDEGTTYRYRAGQCNSATLTTPGLDDAPTAPTGHAPFSAR